MIFAATLFPVIQEYLVSPAHKPQGTAHILNLNS